MIPVQNPITGEENKTNINSTIGALIDFYNAFNNRDIKKMADIWLQSDEIAMDNPLGGVKRGWEEIKSVYDRIFNGSAKVYVEFYDYTIHEGKDIFYAVGRERGKFQFGETIIDLVIRTSRIFKLVNGKWKQVHHHGSIDNPELLNIYQKAVKDS
jgi:ketosteroid isomerase-like protein